MFLLFSTVLWASDYGFDTISCNSVIEAQQLMPNIFLQMGIAVQNLDDFSSRNSSVAYINYDHGQVLRLMKHENKLEETLEELYPHHVRVQSVNGWFILDTQRVLFAQTQEEELRISTEIDIVPTSVSLPSKGCAIQTNRKFSPYLPRTEQKYISFNGESTIVQLELPLLKHHTEAHSLFSRATFLRKPVPLPISLSYAPLTIQLNFSPMYWMYHSAFPLQEMEYTKLFALDPFAAGTIVIFDMQHGAPEIYPTLIAIPFKGMWPPKKETTENILKQLFEAAQFHYRKGEYGYLWREWEVVPVQGGIIISRSKKMLKEALSSLAEEKTWPLISDLQQDFFEQALIGMHYKLEDAARKKKIQINNNLPRELSLTLSPIPTGWKINARSDLKGLYSLPQMLHQSWFEPPPLESPLHPIAQGILSVAGHILAEPLPPQKYLSHQDLVQKNWVQDDSGLYSVHPSGKSVEVHYCSHPKAKKPVHFTWLNGMLYTNPKPCDL